MAKKLSNINETRHENISIDIKIISTNKKANINYNAKLEELAAK